MALRPHVAVGLPVSGMELLTRSVGQESDYASYSDCRGTRSWGTNSIVPGVIGTIEFVPHDRSRSVLVPFRALDA
jgi:hypothetical protein